MTTPEKVKMVSMETIKNILKSALSFIPIAGNLASLYIFEISEKKQLHRIKQLVEELSIRLSNIEEKNIHPTENKFDLIYSCVLASSRTGSEIKIKKYASIIAQSLQIKIINQIDIELKIKYVHIIENLTEYDIMLLDAINKADIDSETGLKKISIKPGDTTSVPLNDFHLFKISFFDLLAKGLIMQHGAPETPTSVILGQRGEVHRFSAYLSYLGYSLIEFLKEVDTDI